ncbi:MAG: hypothetical protein ACP5MD_11815, partial [Verrucomicrobiia bacterium]
GIFPSLAWLKVRGCKSRGRCSLGDFGSGYAGLGNMQASGNPRPTERRGNFSTVCQAPHRRNPPPQAACRQLWKLRFSALGAGFQDPEI